MLHRVCVTNSEIVATCRRDLLRRLHSADALLVNQSLSYSLPSWLIGILCSEVATVYLFVKFSDLLGFIRATVVGVLIPLIASILPIKNALNQNLHDAIDVDHQAGPEMIEYKIERRSTPGRK